MKPVPSDPYLDEIVLVYTPEEFTHMSAIALGWIVQQEGGNIYINTSRVAERQWCQQAQVDLAVGRTLRGAGHHTAACFHSQQLE